MGLHIGVVGVFHPHGPGHLAALDACAEVEQLLVWDPEAAAAAETVSGLSKGALAPGGLEGLLGAKDMPIIVNLQRDCDAAAVTKAALEAGKWVYGDKPGAHTAAHMAEIVAVAEATGNHFCPCYANRIVVILPQILELLRGGAIGQIWSANAHWITSQVALRGPESWLFHREYSTGGILPWLACHWLDLLRVLLDAEATEVMAMVATQCNADIDVEDTASVLLRYDNGAIGNVRAGYSLNPFKGYESTDLYFQLEGSLGGLTWFVRGDRPGYLLRSSHPDYREIGWVDAPTQATPTAAGYSGDFWAAFLEAWRTGGTPPATAQDALAVLRIIEAAYESSATGRKVSL